MGCRDVLRAGAVLLLSLFCGGWAGAQTASAGPSVKTINVTESRVVAAALDIIQERYGVPIDYVDPQYAGADTTQRVSYRPGRSTLIPKIRRLSLEYEEVNGRPVDGITSLIRQLLDQFAAQGGPVLEARKLTLPYGPRWEVYSDQPDVLDATIDIPKQDRTLAGMLVDICQELTVSWNHKFGIASAPGNVFFRYHGELAADHVTARKALLDLMGRTLVLRLYYDPEGAQYAINIVNRRYPEPRRPLPPPPPPPPHHGPVPPGVWLNLARVPQGRLKVQQALASAGYLRTPPATEWNANTADAIRRFQTANGLPASGGLDAMTILKLEPFLPVLRPHPPPRGAIWPDLFYWLQTTKAGGREIQTELSQAGFYDGAVDGNLFSTQMHDALEAFQESNDLQPTGRLDYKTAEKLAPFRPTADK